ncbi:MAG TPA: hypothetical protein VLD83_12120 [Candidatus Binatia bacterium]|nr:hypothetical protein [Candidatus Binatia bacterium]
MSAPILDIQHPSTSELLGRGRGDRDISNHNDTLSSAKLFKVFGFLESETHIAARFRPLKYDDSLEGSIIGVAAIDL